MADLTSLEDAHILLVAVQLASDAEVERILQLAAQRPDVLKPNVLYRILLTHLPVDASLPHLIRLLESVQDGRPHPESFDVPLDLSSVQNLSALAAKHRVSRIHLHRLPRVSESVLSCFLIARAHQVEAANGELPFVLRLVEPFIDQDDLLRTWVLSKLLPLLRLGYEYYPEAQDIPTLRDMEHLQGTAGVGTLLRNTTSSNPGRDLRGLVGPWVYGENAAKRRKTGGEGETYPRSTTGWQDVNEWILNSSVEDLPLAATTIIEWNGPRDIDLGGYGDPKDTEPGDGQEQERRYQQTALALIYSSQATTSDALARSGAVLERAAKLAGLLPPDRFKLMPLVEQLPADIASVTPASLLHNAVLQTDNPLTRPSSAAIAFLEALLASLRILKGFGVDMTVRSAAELCLFGSEEQQKREIHRVLQQVLRMTSTGLDWESTRSRLVYLQNWTGTQVEGHSPYGLLWKVNTTDLHEELFKTMLIANDHNAAISLFFHEQQLLPQSVLEQCVRNAIFNAYDNASNGNRTHGGMKRAYDLLRAFQPHFPESDLFRQVDHLIAATHSLSYYQLTLQHGVPFQPVSIRVHKDPLSLIEKVLEQNTRAHTKVDDLQGIGRNIVLAGLPASGDPDDMQQSTQARLSEAEQRVTFAAINSALAHDDFDTAYSYITSRLSQQNTGTTSDDTSWRAAYAAGRYRPHSDSQTSSVRMANLSKRMDLLSLALTLCSSPDHLPEILDVWRRCEEKMESLKAEDLDEERAWEERSNRMSLASVPGDFSDVEGRDIDIADTRRALANRADSMRTPTSYDDEAPLGLFEVARGAAAAIQKSAFPLRVATQKPGSMVTSGHRSQTSMDEGRPASALSGGADRIRKRDMVSNAVTGGLLKGMSWALGAEPVTPKHDEYS